MKKRRQLLVAVGCVRDGQGRFLLIRRNEPETPVLHGRWEMPGGKIEFGETPEQTVAREVFEETGVDVSVAEMLPASFAAVRMGELEDTHVVVLCFRCAIVGNVREHILPGKVSEVQWVSQEKITDLSIQDGSRSFLRFLMNRR